MALYSFFFISFKADGGHHQWRWSEHWSLATGQFCVFLIFYLSIKTCFLTNLNTDLYHVRGAPLKKKKKFLYILLGILSPKLHQCSELIKLHNTSTAAWGHHSGHRFEPNMVWCSTTYWLMCQWTLNRRAGERGRVRGVLVLLSMAPPPCPLLSSSLTHHGWGGSAPSPPTLPSLSWKPILWVMGIFYFQWRSKSCYYDLFRCKKCKD